MEIVESQTSGAKVSDSNELDEMVGQTLHQATGKAVTGRRVRHYLALLRLPVEVHELADAAGLSEFRLPPVVSLGDRDGQLKTVQRIVQEGLSGRQVHALVKEGKALGEDGKRTVGWVRVNALTPRRLKRKLRSVVAYLKKHLQEMCGASSLSLELRAVEDYREALDEMVNLRDLLNRILGQTEVAGRTPADGKGPGE